MVLKTLCRWILKCVEEQELDITPPFTREWITVHDENTMYSPPLLERKVTSWEKNVCPWWLDYPIGIIPKQELELHESKYFFIWENCFLVCEQCVIAYACVIVLNECNVKGLRKRVMST